MQIEQTRWVNGKGWKPGEPGGLGTKTQLALLFGSPTCLKQTSWQNEIECAYPRAHRLGFSTIGKIYGTNVTDKTLVATAIAFEHTRRYRVSLKLDDVSDSFQASEPFAKPMRHESLVHVLVISDGQNVNGSKSELSSNSVQMVSHSGSLQQKYRSKASPDK